jgi:hypothetical protein
MAVATSSFRYAQGRDTLESAPQSLTGMLFQNRSCEYLSAQLMSRKRNEVSLNDSTLASTDAPFGTEHKGQIARLAASSREIREKR